MNAHCQVNPPSQTLAFILIPGFALTSFSLAVEALSVANSLAGKSLYRYRLYSSQDMSGPGMVTSFNGIPVQTETSFQQCEDADVILLCAYGKAALYENSALFRQLKHWHAQQRRLVSLSGGSFLLAKAGLLKQRSCTVAPELKPTFAELYPDIALQENLYSVSHRILSCAGGMSALDMLLYMIGKDHGREFAIRVSDQFLQDRIRSKEEILHSQRYLQLRMKSATLGAAVEVMENHLSEPCSIEQIAGKIGASIRSLEMTFQKYEQCSPGRYYLLLRLNCARKMLEETHLPISTIAQATGFASQSYFTKRFREQFQCPPGKARQKAKADW